jgi:hypothetical protein
MAMNLFERLNQGRPPIENAQEVSPAQRLLDWLQRWDKPVIRIREIRIYGPRSSRSRKSAIESTNILVKHGWLVPIKTPRRDMQHWGIVRRPI